MYLYGVSTVKIPFNKPFIVGKELYFIAQSVVNSHLSGDGPFTKRCHKWLEDHLGCSKTFLTHSCTAALEMAAVLSEIEQGDEIIMPSFTFVSTANAFVLRGGVPVFVDIRPDNLNIDENLIVSAITSKTKAIVPVHYAGVACAMDELSAIAHQYKLLVIEDAAQAFLSTDKGKYLGTMGHLGCISFHETKNIISGEGGALLINDERFIERAEIIREKGTNRSRFYRGEISKYTWVDIGSSYLPSELVGAFLFAQLEHAESIFKKRCVIFERYYNNLKHLESENIIRLPHVQKGSTCNAHIFYIITRSLPERTALIQYLSENDVNAVFHYVPLHSSPAGVKYGRISGQMTITDNVSDRLLRLPIYHEMLLSDVDRVVEIIYNFYRKRRSIVI